MEIDRGHRIFMAICGSLCRQYHKRKVVVISGMLIKSQAET